MKMFQAKIANDATPVRSPEPLKVGDVVKLKSGGPLMTVSGHSNGHDYIDCVWFNDETKNYLHSDRLPAACLDIFEDDKGD